MQELLKNDRKRGASGFPCSITRTTAHVSLSGHVKDERERRGHAHVPVTTSPLRP
jgi:hypothetical protein